MTTNAKLEKSEFAVMCKRETSLTPVQVELLGEILRSLPFAADLTLAEIACFAPQKKAGEYKNVFEVSPNISPLASSDGAIGNKATQIALLNETFRTGNSLNQWEESEDGSVGVRSFCIKDGASPIAVILLSYRLMLSMTDFTHLIHAVQAVISEGRKFNAGMYERLTKDDGVMIADNFHRIVFADEITRHIYRKMGTLNLLGRLLNENLTESVEREVLSKKAPWEKEMYAGEYIFRERRLDFSPKSRIGHIIITRDITEEKRHQQDLKVQAALEKRIAELEEELAGIKDSLESRKLIDRAKGILMDKENLTEDESYRRIRTMAMMNRMTIKEVASQIIKNK
ncbi:MAG: histidine kinase N-terminal domain-containing protein [Selenomonadaceae bacterium]|nr:histidine kinase N-terminal domain-containing protein [Selenomonadaceae bacterium]